MLTDQGQESFELTKTESGTESKEQKQISIVLDTIFNPNPKLVQTYEDAKATDIWFDKNGRPGYINEERIFAAQRLVRNPLSTLYFPCIESKLGLRNIAIFLI